MKRRNPRPAGQHETCERLQDSMNTSRIASNVVRSAAVGVKCISPTRLHEYFTHCVKNSALSSGRLRSA
ncbi:unnamed protein product [Bemisia tabaci]|uniref:Uncharacterized protein n=1 Tax=Bemisia tabaci TaxID=7038 RepID=A0A9P0A9I5_BEMTA|nr:unnamed protein product [Bemisia tabaci]